MMQSKDVVYAHLNDLPLEASVYLSDNPTMKQTILYFHGGGLIYGYRKDLPEEYIALFLKAGYHFISFDYPLAPESHFKDIYSSAREAVQWFTSDAQMERLLDQIDFILFGRSAGAYLCFLLANDSSIPSPKRLINFYGYHSLNVNEFKAASAHYSQYPQLPETIIKRMIQPNPIATGPLQARYAIYLYARQTGKWIEFLNLTDAPVQTEVSHDALKSLPPTFIAHSQTDQDVPFSIAEQVHQFIPHSYLHRIKEAEHDFDRDPDTPEAKEAYKSLLEWLKRTP